MANFMNTVSEWFQRWSVRPDVVLEGRHEDKSKGALSSFWQDYKKVRVDWRELAGIREAHFQLTLQHYMRIDGPSRDSIDNRIRYICQQRVKYPGANPKKGAKGQAELAKSHSSSSISSHQSSNGYSGGRMMYPQSPGLPDMAANGTCPSGAADPSNGPGVTHPYDSQKPPPFFLSGGDDEEGKEPLGDLAGLHLDPTVKREGDPGYESGGEGARAAGSRKRQRDSGARSSSTRALSAATGAKAAAPADRPTRVPNHWWELELTPDRLGPDNREQKIPTLYPTANCHEWTSDNGIEHRIMEVEFQNGCEVKPPKDRLIENFTANWRPNSDVVYLFETLANGHASVAGTYYECVLGMYEKQNTVHNGMFLYRQSVVDVTPRGGPPWLFWDNDSGNWMVAAEYRRCPPVPLFQYTLPTDMLASGVPGMDMTTRIASPIKVRGCTTLLPPAEIFALYDLNIRMVCELAWQACFRNSPKEVAFDLFCRLMSAQESYQYANSNERFAAEAFDAERREIFLFALVSYKDGHPVVREQDYLAFMEWFGGTLPHIPLPIKVWRVCRSVLDHAIPFASFPTTNRKEEFSKHFQVLEAGGVAGRYCFRFSRQPGHVAVEYTVQDSTFEEGRPKVKVRSYRVRVSAIDLQRVVLRAENPSSNRRRGPMEAGGLAAGRGHFPPGFGVGGPGGGAESDSGDDHSMFQDMFHSGQGVPDWHKALQENGPAGHLAGADDRGAGGLWGALELNAGFHRGVGGFPPAQESVEFQSFNDLISFFKHTLREKCDTSRANDVSWDLDYRVSM